MSKEDENQIDGFEDMLDEDALTAPMGKSMPQRKSGRGLATVLGIVLVAGGLGAGYYYMSGGGDAPPATPPAADAGMGILPPAVPPEETAAADPLDFDTPAPADFASVDSTAESLLDAPVSAELAVEETSALPLLDTEQAITPVIEAAEDIPPQKTAEAALPVPEELNIAPPEIDAPPVQPAEAVEETPAFPAAETSSAFQPGTEDLPMPETAPPQEQLASPAATKPAATYDDVPSPAELALLEHAPALDKMGQGAVSGVSLAETAAAAPLPGGLPVQKALVRPLPKQYLVVKKNRGANEINARLTAGRSALSRNQDSAALNIFTELQQEFPRDSRILMGRAVALQRLGLNDEALAAYESVLTENPKNLEALTNMLGLIKAQDPQLALSKLQELRATYPGNPEIAAQLGVSYGAAGDYPAALKYLDMADALRPGSDYVTYNKAIVYDRMGNSVQAAALYRQIIRAAAEGRLESALPVETIKNRLSVLR